MLRNSNFGDPSVNPSRPIPVIGNWLPRMNFVVLTLVLFCVSAMPVSGQAKTALNEGLEGAVYLEETVGDMDKAIEAYKKVIKESKKQLAVAAEAQFRIGKCYAQKGLKTRSNAAFEAVLDNYLGQTKWVNLAKSQLGRNLELLPVPWGDGDELQLEMRLPGGLPAGYQVYRIQKGMHNGKAVWECDSWQTVTLNNQKGRSHVLADGDSFAPINSQWRHTLLGDAQAVFEDTKATVTMKGKDEPRVFKINGAVYDNEQAAEVFRRLDLRVGMKGKIQVLTSLGMSQVPIGLEVAGMKTIKCPVGEFECFELKLDLGQTFYISNDAQRYIVRFNGGGVEANLTKVRKAEDLGKPQVIETEQFTLTLPPGWHAFSQPNPKHKKENRTMLIDPENKLSAWVEAGPQGSVKKNHGIDSPRKWLQDILANADDKFEDVALDPAGIVAQQVGQHEGLSTQFEYGGDEKRMVIQRQSAFGSSAALSTALVCAKEDADSHNKIVAEIFSSLKIK